MIPPEHTNDWRYAPPPLPRGYEYPSYDAPRPPYDVNHPYPGWIPRPAPRLIPATPWFNFRDERSIHDMAPPGPPTQPVPPPAQPQATPGLTLNSLPPDVLARMMGGYGG